MILFFNPFYIDAFNIGKLIPLLAFSLALGITFLVTIRSKSKRINSIDFLPKDLSPYLAFFCVLVITGLLATENIWRLMLGVSGRNNGLIYYLSVSVISVIVLSYKSNNSHESQISRILTTSGLIFITYSFLQYLGLDPLKWEGSQNPIIGTLGNANFSAAILGSFAVYYLLGIETKFTYSEFFRLFASLTSLFLSWQTDSIQGPLIFLTGVVLFGILQIGRKLKNPKSAYALFLLFGFVGLFMLISFFGLGPFGDRLEQYTLKLRYLYLLVGLRIMLENPITGIGSDSYLFGFLKYRSEDFVQTYGLGVITNNAHSVPFQIGANFGIFAFLLYLFIMLKILFLLLKDLFKDAKLSRASHAVSIFWIVLFIQSLLSIEQLGLGAVTWILGTYLLRRLRDSSQEISVHPRNKVGNDQRPYGEVLLLLSLLFGLLFSIPYGKEDAARRNLIAMQISADSNSEQDRDFFNLEYAKLTSLTLSDPILVTPVLEKLYAVGNIQEIGEISQKLVKENPRDFYAWEKLATYYQIVADNSKRLETLKIMISLDPVNATVILQAAKVSEQLELEFEARKLARRVIEIIPSSPQAIEAQLILDK
jgi:tetratricopeptide (TPR) repeat protein